MNLEFYFLACECNSQGSTKEDGSPCFNKCCNDDGSCQCKTGYIGLNCNNCNSGFYVSSITSGDEKTCSGEESKSFFECQTRCHFKSFCHLKH